MSFASFRRDCIERQPDAGIAGEVEPAVASGVSAGSGRCKSMERDADECEGSA